MGMRLLPLKPVYHYQTEHAIPDAIAFAVTSCTKQNTFRKSEIYYSPFLGINLSKSIIGATSSTRTKNNHRVQRTDQRAHAGATINKNIVQKVPEHKNHRVPEQRRHRVHITDRMHMQVQSETGHRPHNNIQNIKQNRQEDWHQNALPPP